VNPNWFKFSFYLAKWRGRRRGAKAEELKAE